MEDKIINVPKTEPEVVLIEHDYSNHKWIISANFRVIARSMKWIHKVFIFPL